jgi:hypothetical protein
VKRKKCRGVVFLTVKKKEKERKKKKKGAEKGKGS